MTDTETGEINISIRAPARGATQSHLSSCSHVIFQSALPRGERQQMAAGQLIGYEISIRAPARGATVNRCFWMIFFIDFNPRSREESDGQ